MMKKFEFLLGTWEMAYHIPKSAFSEASTGSGQGEFKRALDDKYVYFDYKTLINGEKGQAHAVIAWDEKAQIYRFWWFESSGNFTQATCQFVNDNMLFMNWHDSLLTQTFTKKSDDQVILRMESPNAEGKYELVMEVVFTRK